MITKNSLLKVFQSKTIDCKKTDETLQVNTVPKELRELTDAKNVRSQKIKFGLLTGLQGLMGGAIGATLFGIFGRSLLSHAMSFYSILAIGGGIFGLFNAARSFRKNTGKVEVSLEGEKLSKRFYMNPHTYELSAKEIRHLLLFNEILGDKIQPYQPKETDFPQNIDSNTLTLFRTQANKLNKLADERRLVADFAQKSKYEKYVLNMINANMAVQLIAGGKHVYVVDVNQENKQLHFYRASASSKNELTRMENGYAFFDTSLDYTLHSINNINDLEKTQDKPGIPNGIAGVYRDANKYTQVMKTESEEEYDKVDKRCMLDIITSDPDKYSGGISVIRNYEHSSQTIEHK